MIEPSATVTDQFNVTEALQHLADQVADMEKKHPDSLLIILGDFNRANLSQELPKYRQNMKCSTRDANTLDHCYTALKDSYQSIHCATQLLTDHCMIHLIPTS